MDRPQQPRGGHRAAADASLRAPDARRWLTAPNLLSLARLPMGALFWLVVDDVPAAAIAVHRHPPLALLALIVGRELCQLPLTLTYRLVPRLHHWLRYDFSASPLGKAATVAQFLAVAALLLDHPLQWQAAWLAFIVGMAALVDYLRRAITSPTT